MFDLGQTLNLCQSCVFSGWSARKMRPFFFHLSIPQGGIETQINYSASKNAEEQEVLSPHSTNQSVLMTYGSSGLENRRERGAGWELVYLYNITNPSEGSFLPGHMEMYFADKVMPNWQVMATLGDLFPRLPLGVCGGNHLFSHQALTERSEDKQHPRDTTHSV